MKARRWFVVGICAVAATALVASSAIAHTKAFKTSAKITSGGPTGAKGKIGCPNGCPAKCKAGRTVTLFLKNGANGIPVGSDKTDAKGRWEIDAALTEGDYHVRVKGKVIRGHGHKHSCKAGRSPKVHL
jgi:hypothetical protein